MPDRTDGPRQWAMYAQRQEHVVDGREFMEFGAEQWVRMCYGGDVRPVILTEDPDGMYWGWIDADDPDQEPTMVQPHEGMFSMQFPYGPQAEVNRGQGEIVRLRVDPAEEEDGTQEGCGYSYDHDLKLIDTRAGISTYECRECCAEVVDDDEEVDG